MKQPLHWGLGVALCVLAAGMASSNNTPTTATAARDYLALRQSVKAVPLTPAVAANRASWRGKTLALVGKIIGRTNATVATLEKPLTFMLQVPGVTEVMLVSSASDDPLIAVDEVVHVLAALPEAAGPTDQPLLKAIIAETALPEAERTYAAAAAKYSAQTEASLPAATTGPALPEGAANESKEKDLKVQSPPPAAPATLQPKAAPPRPGTEPPKVLASNVPESKVGAWKRWVGSINPRLNDAELELIVRSVLYYAALFGLDHRLAFAMIKCESSFNPRCQSHAGAMGLTQLMPGTARAVGVSNPWDMERNIMGGLKYLSQQLHNYEGRSNYEQFALGLASYNAGPNAVKRAGGVPNYPETVRYVKKVGDLFYKLWKDGMP